MKHFVGWILVLVSITVLAQTQTTSNLIDPSGTAWGIPSNQVLPQGQISQVEGAGYTTGTAYYNSNTNTIRFGYLPSTVAQTIAINQALSGTGIQVGGFNWSYQWMNGGYNSGTLTGSIAMTDNLGNVTEYQSFNHPIQPDATWQVESGTKTFTNPYALPSLGNLTMSFTGYDNRFWMGLYGPRVRDPSLTLNYTVNQCAANPLSSPDCPGYATAYFNQQCTISALYNASCPGYGAAYFAQQCTANPLYDPACPGYAEAYKTQQCSINALYATDCPGYQQAYFTQQCQANGLYSTQCPNYAEAYAKQQLLSTTTTSPITTVAVAESTTTAKTDPISIATTSTTTSTTSPTSVTSVTSVVSGGTSNATTAAIASTSTQSTTPTTTSPTTTEAKKTDAEVRSVTGSSSTSSTGSAKGRAEAVARQVAREASEAKTFESQTATQGLVVGLMGYVPGFDTYGQARILDINGQHMTRLYGRPTVDNRQALRRLTGASDRLHTDMVDQQYQLGK